jgi:PAS domain S-box-containing protein
VPGFMNLSISRKLMAAFAGVVAVIFVSSAVVYDRLRVIEEAKNSRVHTTHVLEMLQSAMDAMLDQETGVRGYLISGNEGSLEPYHSGSNAFAAAFRKLKDLTSDNPAQQSRLDELNELAPKWRSEVAERAIALMAKPETREDARALEGSMAGKAAMDLIRAKVDEIARVERDLLAKRDAVQTHAYATAYMMTILGATASLAIAILMGVLLTRAITMPITRMTSAMAALAKGNTSVEVPEVGRDDEIGAMAAAVAVFKHIMIERQRAEEALRESEERFRTLVQFSFDVYWETDAQHRFIRQEFADAAADAPGPGSDIGKTRWEVPYLEPDAEAWRKHRETLDAHLPFRDFELARPTPDGGKRYVSVSGLPLFDETGRFIGYRGVARHVTERKQAEESLRESEERFRTFVDHATDAFMLHNEDGTVLDVNRHACESLGYSRDELIGMTRPDFDPDVNAAILRGVRERLKTGETVTFESRHRRKDGTVFPVEIRVREFRQSDRILSVTLARDITERKRAAETLREMQMELEHANRVATMGQLTASIAHEVSQPIAATVTDAEAALRWLGRRPPDLERARQTLGRIIKSGGRAGEVIGRIRGLVKKAPPRKESMDINSAILDVIALTRSEVLRHGVSLQTDLATGLPLIEGDRVPLQQVILNLILNAVEAMSCLDEARELRISTKSDASNGVLVAVRDTGPGLDPKSVDRLFEAFYTTKPEGMGMGLAICRSIIEAHGGRLWATANEPQGSVFQFTLPPERDETVPAERADQMPVV